MAENQEYDPVTGCSTAFREPELERVRRAISDLISPSHGDLHPDYTGPTARELTLMVCGQIFASDDVGHSEVPHH